MARRARRGDRWARCATLKRDAATVERDAATVERDAATVERDAATVGRNAASRERDATAAVSSMTTVERLAEGDPEAAVDRQHAASDPSYASLDELTGVFAREAGELALVREIDRARRSGRSLVLAVIDIDALQEVNDNLGHAAGDALLRDVPTAITSTLRSYDVTVRWGGDAFVCGLSDVTLAAASDRIAEIQQVLEARRPRASVSAGLAELEETDTLESLIARADADLYCSRRGAASEAR